MKLRYMLGLFIFVLLACKDDNLARSQAREKEQEKNLQIFKTINKHWQFKNFTVNNHAQALVQDWAEWRLFLGELDQKPTSSLGAFQSKAKQLSQKIQAVSQTVPAEINRPEIKGRILVLMTKINALDMFIHLDEIPTDELALLIGEINTQIKAIETQLEEFIRRRQIPLEEGEDSLLEMIKDTTRAARELPKNIENFE